MSTQEKDLLEELTVLVVRQGEWFEGRFYEKPGGLIFKFELVTDGDAKRAFFAGREFFRDPEFGKWLLKHLEVINAQKTRARKAETERSLN